MTNSTNPIPGTGNQYNISLDTVFTTGLNTETSWKLKPNSLGISAGRSGVNIGMYDGPYPYVLSGLPAMPTVTYLFVPLSASVQSGLSVQFRAKGRN